MLDLRTPSSPHSTSSSMTSASPTAPNSDVPAPRPPFRRARSLPSLSYRYALSHLRGAFPTLPERSQFNHLVRFHAEAIEEIALHLGQIVEGDQAPYQALDASAMPVRDAKRRGHGWLAGYADIGWSNSLGWYLWASPF